MDSKLTDAYEQLKEQRAQLTARDNELERVNLKLEESETDNAGLKQSLESLETTRTELKKKLNETELLAQNLERQKEDLEAEVEVRNNTFFHTWPYRVASLICFLKITNPVLKQSLLTTLPVQCWQNKGGDMDSKLADAYEQMKELRTQLTARVNELESIQAKADESENENTVLKKNIENLEEVRSELKKKLNETELFVKTLEREKQDLSNEVQVRRTLSISSLAQP